MRVLHLARPAAGGVLRFLQNVVPRLEREGIECAIACPSSMHPSLSSLHTLRWNISDRPQMLTDLQCALLARGWQKEYDVLHAHGLRTVGVLALAPPRRWIYTLHNLPPQRLAPSVRWLLHRAVHSAERMLSVSQAVRDAWLHHFPQSASKCEVIYGGVDVDALHVHTVNKQVARQQWNLPDDVPVALCVARLMEDKGVDNLLKALVHAPRWFALIVGEGPQYQSLLRMATELGVIERARFAGYLPVLDSVWAACDVVVIPSRREGLGLVALEAMAVGKPVIASATGGLAEVVLHGETGWLIPPDEPSALANALQLAISQSSLWHDMGRRGKEHVRQHFTWDYTARRLLDVYRRLTNM